MRKYQSLLAALLATSLATAAQGGAHLSAAEAEAKVAALEKRVGGRIGLYALNTRTGVTLEHRAGERFAMCSTFKWLLAAAVQARAVDSGPAGLSLATRIPYGEAELHGWAPVTREHLKDGAMTVEALADAAVELSDNGAANLLLPLVGGPRGLTGWLRERGDRVTRVDRNEPTCNTNLRGDPRDTTTPAASAADLRALLLGDALPRPARERLTASMERTRTGDKRLRAGLPPGSRVADKTGTCDRGAVNDLAVVWGNGDEVFVIAAYLSDSGRPAEELEPAHAELARIVLRALARNRW